MSNTENSEFTTINDLMRLSPQEIQAIQKVFLNIYGDSSRIWLFGSRVDLNKRGGDIDLYVETKKENLNIDKKLDFLYALQVLIGEQKIDLVAKEFDCQEIIALIAKSEGIQIL